jgi:anthranilate synthase component 1
VTGFRELVSRPDLLAVHRRHPAVWPFLLESAAPGGMLGRWSMLLRADVEVPPIVERKHDPEPFLERLDRAFASERADQPGRLPFEGGWFVYAGYELAGEIERKLVLPPAPDEVPVAFAQRCRGALILDHDRGRLHAVAESEALLDAIERELAEADPDARAGGETVSVAPVPEIRPGDGERFKRGVERIREYILAGDVFQVNLSREWRGESAGRPDAVAIYERLTQSNPAPFGGLARLPGGTVLSSPRERLVTVRDGIVSARPIAGTRPRGASPDRDRALSAELLAHPKERAEHIMLIDLVRNDLGRISRPGSVKVDELMVLESYTHVHHIVSNIRGELAAAVSPADVIRACFPGGTITGCPKVRCMEIIAELEVGGRGLYTGSMGYLGRDGRMDLNILIRSMLVADDGIRFRTGAGIVADSEPEAELAETEAKARGLMRALDP